MTFGGPGFHIQGPAIVVESFVSAAAFLFLGSLVWVCRDARKRRKSGLVTLLFILVTGWPVSFLWWFWPRPPRNLRAGS